MHLAQQRVTAAFASKNRSIFSKFRADLLRSVAGVRGLDEQVQHTLALVNLTPHALYARRYAGRRHLESQSCSLIAALRDASRLLSRVQQKSGWTAAPRGSRTDKRMCARRT